MKRLGLLAALVVMASAGGAANAGGTAALPPTVNVPAGYSATLVTTIPRGFSIGFDASGDLLAGTLGTGCFDSSGQLLQVQADGTTSLVATGLSSPQAIVPGPGGVWGTSTYVDDSDSGSCYGKIFRVDPAGLTALASFGSLGMEPRGIAFDPTGGSMWIVEASRTSMTRPDSGYLEQLLPGGSPTVVATGFPLGDPTDVAFGPGGAYGTGMYISDYGEFDAGGVAASIERYAGGAVTQWVLAPPGVHFGRLAFAQPGAFGGLLYVVDATTSGGAAVGQLVTVSPGGALATFATLGQTAPDQEFWDVVAAPDGRSLYALVGGTGGQYLFRIDAADTTAPRIACDSPDGVWHGGDVTLSCTADDPGSGLADPADASFTLTTSVPDGSETADAQTGTHQVCDNAGNCATAGPIGGNMVDRKAPEIACGAPDGLWHADNVTIACAASDGGSGLGNAGDASFGLSTSVPAGSADANASTGTHDVCDGVGNCATAGPIAGNMVDRAAPVLDLPADITTSVPVVTYTATATDDDDPSPAVSCAPASGSTFPAGTTTVSCTATDHAGNTTSGSFTVTVTDPYARLVQDADAIGRANVKAHVRNLGLVGGNGYCSQLKVIAKELAALRPQSATVLDAEDATAALQRAAGCSG